MSRFIISVHMCNLPIAPLDPNLQVPREKAIDMHSNKFVNKIIITKSGVLSTQGSNAAFYPIRSESIHQHKNLPFALPKSSQLIKQLNILSFKYVNAILNQLKLNPLNYIVQAKAQNQMQSGFSDKREDNCNLIFTTHLY